MGSSGSAVLAEVGLRSLFYPLGSNIVVRTACCSVGIVLPVLNTFRAIQRKDPNEQQKCLLHWAAYGSFSLAELYGDRLLLRFPLYYHIKFAFLVWLQLPPIDDARRLYVNYLHSFFLRQQARIQSGVNSAVDELVNKIDSKDNKEQGSLWTMFQVTGGASYVSWYKKLVKGETASANCVRYYGDFDTWDEDASHQL
ncbi:hypothetical protein GIB67_017446 [Kingdonia uniflora]|uniref:HVA22-like protein n=1 Tax=Kingdonia uniflora TaxID=39325 RepID=A0A7J7M4B9_9MAGN|nr:hypothetical protein GIB67_017446 [Kingdonia uniflora]